MDNEDKYRRVLKFKENKVNVITGGSHTGKTAILRIVDYLFFASKHKIPESKINENIAWYGINFKINDKHFTLSRKSPNKNNTSNEYYFSSTGEIPETPFQNITENNLKKTLETEFNIDRNVTIPFGGKSLKQNSKISLRYFMLFNTISGDIIQHSEVFFDKQNENRYREALPRVFDLSIGIETVENILKRDKKSSLQSNLDSIEKKNRKISDKKIEFHEELQSITRKAKEYGVINENDDVTNAIESLKLAINNESTCTNGGWTSRIDELTSEKNLLERRIKNLTRFNSEYKKYKSNLKVIEDSLKPVKYWSSRNEIVKTSIFEIIVSSLEEDLQKVKNINKNKTPIDGKIFDEISACQKKIKLIEEEENILPKNIKCFKDDRDKFIFLGQTKEKIELYEPNEENVEPQQTKEIEDEIESIHVFDTTENKDLCVKVLEEIIQGYMKTVKPSLDTYSNYQPVFNYKDKKIDFRKPKTTHLEAAGSSSNDMFKHLFMFLSLHELMLTNNSKHVPSFLIIDQLSRPYYGEEKNVSDIRLQNSDKSKVIDAFKLLNGFLENTIKNLKAPFQIIVFEHVPTEYFKEFEHIHLVEEFREGNALVPKEYLDTLN